MGFFDGSLTLRLESVRSHILGCHQLQLGEVGGLFGLVEYWGLLA